MATIKKAYCLEQDAREEAESYCPQNGYIESASGDCWTYPCPRELDSWSGETPVYNVFGEDGEWIASVAYWCNGDEELENED